MLYVRVRDVMDVVVSVCIVRRGGVCVFYGKCEGSVMHVLYMCVLCASCGILNAANCMTCSLLMLVEDARGNHSEEEYSRAGLMTAL